MSKPTLTKNKRGSLNVAMAGQYAVVVKAAKMSGMKPTTFARIVIADAAEGVTSGRLHINATPQISATQSV